MAQRRATIQADPRLALGLIRRSTGKQDLTPEAQRSAIERWAASRGVTVVEWFTETITGGADLEERTELLTAIDRLGDLHAGLLVVAKRDRLARDPVVAALVERLVERQGARVVSAAGEGTDGDSPTDILMRRIVDAFAEYEKLVIRARTRAALATKRARGERVGDVRLGFRLANDGRTELEDEREQACIALARRLRAEGLSLRAVGAELLAQGFLPRAVTRRRARAAEPVTYQPESWDAKQIARMVG